MCAVALSAVPPLTLPPGARQPFTSHFVAPKTRVAMHAVVARSAILQTQPHHAVTLLSSSPSPSFSPSSTLYHLCRRLQPHLPSSHTAHVTIASPIHPSALPTIIHHPASLTLGCRRASPHPTRLSPALPLTLTHRTFHTFMPSPSPVPSTPSTASHCLCTRLGASSSPLTPRAPSPSPHTHTTSKASRVSPHPGLGPASPRLSCFRANLHWPPFSRCASPLPPPCAPASPQACCLLARVGWHHWWAPLLNEPPPLPPFSAHSLLHLYFHCWLHAPVRC